MKEYIVVEIRHTERVWQSTHRTLKGARKTKGEIEKWEADSFPPGNRAKFAIFQRLIETHPKCESVASMERRARSRRRTKT